MIAVTANGKKDNPMWTTHVWDSKQGSARSRCPF